MKRLVAVMMAVSVCLWVFGVVMAEDGHPGICWHSYVETRRFMGNHAMDGTHHHEIWSVDKVACTKCGYPPRGFTPHTEKKVKSHFCIDQQIYQYHADGYHYFYNVCVCGVPMNQRKVLCPGDDNHRGLMGSHPVVVEVK